MPKAPNTARHRIEIEERRLKVAELWALRLPQREMARQLGVSLGTVNGDLAFLVKEWKRKRIKEVDAILSQELADLDAMERRLAILTHKRGEKITPGDAVRLSDGRLHIKDRRAKQLGLDASVKTEVTGSEGGPVKVIVDHVGREEWSGT
jgi:hypothetical protein